MNVMQAKWMNWSAVLFLGLTGCSSTPVANLLDRFYPGELEPGPLHGGVKTVVSTPDPPLNSASAVPEVPGALVVPQPFPCPPVVPPPAVRASVVPPPTPGALLTQPPPASDSIVPPPSPVAPVAPPPPPVPH